MGSTFTTSPNHPICIIKQVSITCAGGILAAAMTASHSSQIQIGTGWPRRHPLAKLLCVCLCHAVSWLHTNPVPYAFVMQKTAAAPPPQQLAGMVLVTVAVPGFPAVQRNNSLCCDVTASAGYCLELHLQPRAALFFHVTTASRSKLPAVVHSSCTHTWHELSAWLQPPCTEPHAPYHRLRFTHLVMFAVITTVTFDLQAIYDYFERQQPGVFRDV